MRTLFSDSEESTRRLAAMISGNLSEPVTILLEGDLGAGKTHFAQGFAQGLGVSETISSPTFALLNRYPLPDRPASELLHFDLYRLEDPYLEWELLGFEELVEGSNFCLVEWPLRIAEFWSAKTPKIEILRVSDHVRKLLIPAELLSGIDTAEWQGCDN
ncbi:MAG: tRNA (adenosine(37)-N6)-threonylcarbamoyltransferase complex ATPase subunit type 1 TsaE [Eubacteriales bacterium]|nr:tRNA (adenosine(37)-N6)-threonylcarbamoyltransferase complex ATPase subunit type 1 TsaE [Eubacteriales bacterium]